ncbi:MAG: hypothetical protein ACOVQT_09060 [Rubrivivax sp.]
MTMNRMVLFRLYFEGGRYERFQRLVVLRGDTAELEFFGYDWTGNGAARAFLATQYRLLVNGAERASVQVPPGATSARITLDLRTLPDGWHDLELAGATSETCPTLPVYVQRSGLPVNSATVPVALGTYGLIFESPARHWVGRVPARFQPVTRPLAPRETPAFNTTLRRGELVQTQLVPTRPHDVHRLSRNADGLLSTSNVQWYFWSDFVAARPRVPLLDGPRGRGTVGMTTHLQVGRRDIYFCDPWRVGKVRPDGEVVTLVGWRHRGIPSNYGDKQPDLELVGDWSAIPPARHGFHELWGMAWDARTLAVNEAAAPIPSEDNDKPHLVGPVAFLADTQNNRIVRVQFAPDRRDVPPKVTEFITGLADPWDVVYDNGLIYVSERTAHRLSAFDARTGARVRTVLEGPDYAGVNSNRFVYRRVPLAAVRTAPVVAPEGLFVQDGWLYFGSRAMEQVKRVHLADGRVERVADVPMDNNSQFAKIAVSDGTFGPRGSVFVAHWSVLGFGYPHAFLPDGRSWDYIAGSDERGTPWVFSSYPCAVAVGGGRMITGSVTEGLNQFSRALPGDARVDRTRYLNGSKDYLARGLNLLYGHAGWGLYGLPLPWGQSADIDYYLEWNGHRR